MKEPRSTPRRAAARRASSRATHPSLRRLLIAACAGLATLALTRWPVAAIAVLFAVLFLPRVASSRTARRRASPPPAQVRVTGQDNPVAYVRVR